ncbi:unnamed protein product [Allacma fusca]|uniref:Uncharacterized protein n=1 Tax=Allacma fusca TaxID=39272 RepID=A0A8J2K2Y2_9HEXA|nr:unnamed protein product [Allacma fusca]
MFLASDRFFWHRSDFFGIGAMFLASERCFWHRSDVFGIRAMFLASERCFWHRSDVFRIGEMFFASERCLSCIGARFPLHRIYLFVLPTEVYFFAFAVLTGSMAYLELRSSLGEKSEMVGGPNMDNSTATGTNSTGNTIRIEPTKQGSVNSTSVNPPSQSPLMSLVLILLDFSCEVFGFISSIVLIYGLFHERKLFLVPWMIAVPTHTIIDIYTVCEIVVVYLGSKSIDADPGQDSYGALLLLTAVSITATINMYALLCVFSQYMEYKAGRGTAAHENLLSGGSFPGGPGSFRGGRPNQKPDTWYEDLIFNQSKHPNCMGKGDIPLSLLEKSDSKKSRGDSVPTVRFENETSSSSGECVEPRQKLISKKSNFDNLTSCRNLSVPSSRSRKSGYSTPTLMEESTTADSIEEM